MQLVILLLAMKGWTSCNGLTLKGGGYKGVVVAIDKQLPQVNDCPLFLKNLQVSQDINTFREWRSVFPM